MTFREFRAIACVAIASSLQCQVARAEKYERLDPSELSCVLEGVSFSRVVTESGYKMEPGGEVERLICAGQDIELVSKRIEGEFLRTKKFGKIKIDFTESTLLRPTASVWVAPEQKAALQALKPK